MGAPRRNGRWAMTPVLVAYMIALTISVRVVDGGLTSSWAEWAKSFSPAKATDTLDSMSAELKDNDDTPWPVSQGAITVKDDSGAVRQLGVLRYHDPQLEEHEHNHTTSNSTDEFNPYRIEPAMSPGPSPEKPPLSVEAEKQKQTFEALMKKEQTFQTQLRDQSLAVSTDQAAQNDKLDFPRLNETFQQRWVPFLLSTSKACAENMPTSMKPVHWAKADSPSFDTTVSDFEHDEFRQVLYDNWIMKYEILYKFKSGLKTLKQRFLDAATAGEPVTWEVRVGSSTVKTYEGIWWFSKGATINWVPGKRFSSDDGSFGAADGEVDGHETGKCLSQKKERFGVENCNGNDNTQCGIYYLGKDRIISDHLRNVMYAGVSPDFIESVASDGRKLGQKGRNLASRYCNWYRSSITSGYADGGANILFYGSNYNTGYTGYRVRFRDSSGREAWSSYARPSQGTRVTIRTPTWSHPAYGNTIYITLWEGGTECSKVDARSCMHIRNSATHLYDGNYQLADGRTVYCDMDNDGGGWMMAVQIDGNDQDHSNAGHVGASIVTPSVSYTSKYDDSIIRRYIGTSIIGSQAQIKFICAGRHHYYKNCHFNAVGQAGGNWASCVINYDNYLANSIRNAQSCNCGSQALGAHCASAWWRSMNYCSHCHRGPCCCAWRNGCGHDQYGYSQRGSVWVRGGYSGSYYTNQFSMKGTWQTLSRTTGYADGAHSVVVTGRGFNTGYSDYRCQFRASNGQYAWSSNVRPSSSTQITCRSPTWSYKATGNVLTVYLYERSNTEMQFSGSSRPWTYSPTYHSLSRTSGYADGAHSVTVYGYGFDTGRSDYRCRFRDSAGHQAYSAYVRPASGTSVSCRSPAWSWTAYGNAVSVYLMEGSQDVTWRGSARTWTYQSTYHSISRTSCDADGGCAVTVTGYGFDISRTDYRCRFRDNAGHESYSANVKPTSVNSFTCIAPVWYYTATSNAVTVYAMERSTSNMIWRGSSRTWYYTVTYKSISRTSGYADGTHSVTITGHGFNTGLSDYRCRFRDQAGHQLYSAYVRPSSTTSVTCRSPVWTYTATSNPTTVYLMERSNNDVRWRGSARTWTYIVTYKSLSRSSGYANGAHSLTIYGNGFDTSRSDYRCRFRDGSGNTRYSANVKPSSSTALTCRSPVWDYGATSNPTTLYLMERSNNDITWRGSSRTWTYIVTYKSLSLANGYADGTHSVTISGNGFRVDWSDYRCEFRDSSGRNAYSAYVRPSSDKLLTCRTPVWYFTATGNPATLYLRERSTNIVQWVGSARLWTYTVTYKSIGRTSGYANGAHSVTISGNGFDTSRSDYRCRFSDQSGQTVYSSYTRPASTTSVTCRSPVWTFGATDNPTTVYLLERSNNAITWRGSARTWTYIVNYQSLSRTSGYADGTHSVIVYGNGFHKGWNNYRCRFRDSSGHTAYSVMVTPNDDTSITCRTPAWLFAATDNPTTLYLMEKENNDILWLGSTRTWTYIITYKAISRSTGYANGAHSVTVSGNGFNIARSDYRCRFVDTKGRTRYSEYTKPTSGTQITCRTPVWIYSASENPTTLYLMEYSNNDITWRGSARTWTFIVTYRAISISTGYADGTHSVTVYGNGFNIDGWSDYRCRFRDEKGNTAYSAAISSSSDTHMTCRSPVWYFAATHKPTTLYLMEHMNNDVTWVGAARTWVYQVNYHSAATSTKSSNSKGGKSVVLTGNGFDSERSDYTCVFRNALGYERVSSKTSPTSSTSLTCTTPSFGDNLRLTEVILKESDSDVLYRGHDKWERVFFFARPFYLGWHSGKNIEVATYFDDTSSMNIILESPLKDSGVSWASLSISTHYNGVIYFLAKGPNRILSYDTSTNGVQFVSPTLTLTISTSPGTTTDFKVNTIECDENNGLLYGIVSRLHGESYHIGDYMVKIDPISGVATMVGGSGAPPMRSNVNSRNMKGVTHGVSAAFGSTMVFVQRPENLLTFVDMPSGSVRKEVSLPMDVLVHSLEYSPTLSYDSAYGPSPESGVFTGTAFDQSSKTERVYRLHVSGSSLQFSRGANVEYRVRQGASSFDTEATQSFAVTEDEEGKQDIKMLTTAGEMGTNKLPPEVTVSFVEYTHGWTKCVYPYYYDCNSCNVLVQTFKNIARVWGAATCNAEFQSNNYNAAKGNWGMHGCNGWWSAVKGSASPCSV